MCCPKRQPMEFHPPKSNPERQIAPDLGWTEKVRNYENLWNSFPYLKPLNFIPPTIIYRTVLPICPYWKVILCCHVLPKTSANGIPSPKSYPERQIALDLGWTEKIRNYENLSNSFPYLKPLNFIPSTITYRMVCASNISHEKNEKTHLQT